jgi:cobyric acid synthase
MLGLWAMWHVPQLLDPAVEVNTKTNENLQGKKTKTNKNKRVDLAIVALETFSNFRDTESF